MKGIILAGGSGTRLFPLTRVISKQLLPIYNKPMIYYPLSVLLLGDIRDVLIITTPAEQSVFRRLFGDGNQLGISLSYEMQTHPRGLADAFIVGRDFIGSDNVALILGDNLFCGAGLSEALQRARSRSRGATIFAHQVSEPTRYGVVELDAEGQALSLEEKPERPKSNHAVTGLYFYDNRVIDLARELRPSARGELEITDINREYMKRGSLFVERMGRGFAWFDTGTCDSLLEAAQFVQALEHRQGVRIGCIEEIAWRKGYIGNVDLEILSDQYVESSYRNYLRQLLKEKK